MLAGCESRGVVHIHRIAISVQIQSLSRSEPRGVVHTHLIAIAFLIVIAHLIAISIQFAIAWHGTNLTSRDRVLDRDLHPGCDLYN